MADDLMIEVANLTKRYSGHVAVDRLSFSVGRGEIVGFLGPNGAGKSTTMRMLSCFMPATSGTARVAGFDVFKQADEVRRRIGYMPENNPLHLDMRVREYLKFRGRLKGLGVGESRRRVTEVTELCGLEHVSKKIIGTLSKGYRQRVGLADALVHNPELIILDEPTIGLDPHQIRSVRELIRNLREKHTVLISSHILHEVEMTCNRVLIMHQGRILASDTPANLEANMSRGRQVICELRAPVEGLRAFLKLREDLEFHAVTEAEEEDGFHRCILTPLEGLDPRAELHAEFSRRNWTVRELTRSRCSLEDIFVHITSPENREEEA